MRPIQFFLNPGRELDRFTGKLIQTKAEKTTTTSSEMAENLTSTKYFEPDHIRFLRIANFICPVHAFQSENANKANITSKCSVFRLNP